MPRVYALAALMALTACDDHRSTVTMDLAMNGHDLAMAPGADLSQTTTMDLAAAAGDMATSGMIPPAGSGTAVNGNWADSEPNDTPDKATPVGLAGSAQVYLWVSSNTIGGTDTADYFVFQTGASAGTFSLGGGGLCWSGNITGMSATLWKVASGQQVLPPVQTWTPSASCTPSGSSPAIEANTEYLLGIFATGGAGMYFA